MSATTSGVIFDLDGTLIDSEPSWARGFSLGLCQVLEERGHGTYELVPEDMARFRGGRVPDTVATLLGELGLDERLDADEARRVVSSVIAWVTEDVAASPVPIHEAVDTARALHLSDVPLAVASSSALPFIDAALEALGLREAFPIRLSAIDLPRGKPDPLVYLLTLEQMGLPSASVIAIEDSPVGVEAAVRAGMRCVWFMPGTGAADRADQLRALAAAVPPGDGPTSPVDTLVSPVATLSGDDVLRMLHTAQPRPRA